MTRPLNIRRFVSAAGHSAARIKAALMPLQRLLFFSAADEAVFPRKGIAASLEPGRLSVAAGSTFLSHITFRGLREYSFEEGAYPTPDEVASSLVLAANELGMTRPSVSLVVPKSWAVVAAAEFPATVKENLSDVVAYELDRVTPFSADDAYYDYRVTGDTGSRITLQVMAVRVDAVRPYVRALEENGFGVERLTVNVSCLGTLCRYGEKLQDCMVARTWDGSYDAGLILRGVLMEARSGHLPAGDEQSRSAVLAAELQSLAEVARSHGRGRGLGVLLQGPVVPPAGLLKDIPVRQLESSGPAIRLPADTKRPPNTAAGALLESLWPGAGALNLLSRGIAPARKAPWLLTALLALCLAGLGILYLVSPLRFEEQRLKELSHQIALRKDEVKKVETMKKEEEALASELAVIDGFKKGHPMTIGLMKELTTVLPKTAWLTRTRITETTVELEGYASSATELLPKLESSPYFRKVEFASPTFRDARMNADRFVIRMEIEGAVKEEEKPRDEKAKHEKK